MSMVPLISSAWRDNEQDNYTVGPLSVHLIPHRDISPRKKARIVHLSKVTDESSVLLQKNRYQAIQTLPYHSQGILAAVWGSPLECPCQRHFRWYAVVALNMLESKHGARAIWSVCKAPVKEPQYASSGRKPGCGGCGWRSLEFSRVHITFSTDLSQIKQGWLAEQQNSSSVLGQRKLLARPDRYQECEY